MKVKKNPWFITTIILALALLIVIILGISRHPYKLYNEQFEDPVEEAKKHNNSPPEDGYISNAEIAARIGSAIIDEQCRSFGKKVTELDEEHTEVWISYNEDLRIWKIAKGYHSHRGGVVYLSQDTGEVLSFYFQK